MAKHWIWLAAVAAVVWMTLVPVRAETGGKLVALTFDDGPSGKYTETLLDGLKERNVKVTFFVLGQNAQDHPQIVRRAAEEGHEIECHSWNHPDFTELEDGQIDAQLWDSYEVLDPLCGKEGDYLVRPPYGSTDERVRSDVGRPMVCWSVDSRDWESRDTDKVREKILEDVYDGAIILCHDIHGTTIPAALQVIDRLTEEGYEFVTVRELYRRRGIEMENGNVYYDCKANGVDLGAPETAPTAAAPETIPAADSPIGRAMPTQQAEEKSVGGGWWLFAGGGLLLLAAALARGSNVRKAKRFLEECRKAQQIHFRAEIHACREDTGKELLLDCAVQPDGEVRFQALQPQRIAGAAGVVAPGKERIFRENGDLRTVGASWMLAYVLREGHLRRCGCRGGRQKLTVAATWNGETIPAELILRRGELEEGRFRWRTQRFTIRVTRFHWINSNLNLHNLVEISDVQ